MDAPRNAYQAWQEGIRAAPAQPGWDDWDCEIRAILAEYARWLAGQAGFVAPDWLLVKAIIWTETGANHPQWKLKPMQIGVDGDPALDVVLSGQEGSALVIPPAIASRLTRGSVRVDPRQNLRAGIGYLLMRHARTEIRRVPDMASAEKTVPVQAGDSLDRIARRHGSTVAELQALDPGAALLRPGQLLRVRKASMHRVIVGWIPMTTQSIAARYNGGGDPRYAEKLDFVLSVLRVAKPLECHP